MNTPENRVRVQAAPDHITTTDIRNDITALRAPVALEEAKCVISLDGPLRDRLVRVTKCSGESDTSLSERCWMAVVKNDDASTSSQRSNPVKFHESAT